MTWKVRHEGSPQSVEGLSLEQVLEGLDAGRWEPTDEVMGPQDPDWVPIESHPATADAAAELEPPPPRTYDDETRLDMNALIDVTLVLLIFFILTTTYSVLQKRMESPDVTKKNAGPVQLKKGDVEKRMIRVAVKMEDGRPVVRMEGKETAVDDLAFQLRSFVRSNPGRNELLLEHDDEVPHGVVVAVEDKARLAGMDRVHLLIPPTAPAGTK